MKPPAESQTHQSGLDDFAQASFLENGMKKSVTLAWVVATALATTFAFAQDQKRDQTKDQTQDQLKTSDQLKTQDRDRDQLRDRDIYGSKLMTSQERNEYRNRMRAAKTAQEREQIRAEHHEQMKVRAKERGVSLPDVPPSGRGPGAGAGGGAGGGGGGGGGGRGK